MDNRETRRKKKAMFKRELRTASFDDFKDITFKALNSPNAFPPGMGKLIGFHKNSLYSVQHYIRADGVVLLGIRRHDEKKSCPWSHKQKIKNILLGEDANAIEIFPSEEDLVDAANIYWLWCGESIDKVVKSLGGLAGGGNGTNT